MSRRRRLRARFARRIPGHLPYVRGLARRLARGDGDLYDDLVQEGLIGMWEADLDRTLGANDAQQLERAAIAHRMFWFLGKERANVAPRQSRPLEAAPEVLLYSTTGSLALLVERVDVEWAKLQRSGDLMRRAAEASVPARSVWRLRREQALQLTAGAGFDPTTTAIIVAFAGAAGTETARALASVVCALWREQVVPRLRRSLGRGILRGRDDDADASDHGSTNVTTNASTAAPTEASTDVLFEASTEMRTEALTDVQTEEFTDVMSKASTEALIEVPINTSLNESADA